MSKIDKILKDYLELLKSREAFTEAIQLLIKMVNFILLSSKVCVLFS